MDVTGASRSNRTESRFQAVLPAMVHLGDGDVTCSAENLSRHGAMLVGDLPELDAPDLMLTIYTPTEDLVLRATARIAYRGATSDGRSVRMGLQFEALDEAQAKTLESLVQRVMQDVAPAPLAHLNRKSSIREIREALSRIPQAHRVNLAARGEPLERLFCRADDDPEVLNSLARNPNITLPEIRQLVLRKELLPTTLDWISRDPRWFHDEETRFAIATHIRVTFNTADRIVTRLSDLQVQRLLRRPGLHAGVRKKLMIKLGGKFRGQQ